MPFAAQRPRPNARPLAPIGRSSSAPRVERTLPNGMRVIVSKQTVVPKVTLMLTVLSGFSSDPPTMTGLADPHG